MPDNSSKYVELLNGQPVYGPDDGNPAHQNFGVFQERIADEIDASRGDVVGSAIATGFVVAVASGLGVSISAGIAYFVGQRARQSGTTILSGLPANATGLKVYLGISSPYDFGLIAWPVAAGFTDGALPANTLLLALVNTSSSAVTLVTDQRSLSGTLVNAPSTGEKAALAGTTGTPGDVNRYVTQTDPLLPTAGQKAALVGTSGTPSADNPYITDADARLLDADSGAALAGTSGAPSNTNRFVTNADARNTNARTPTPHAASHASAGSDPLAHADLGGLTTGDPHTQYRKLGEVACFTIETLAGDPGASPSGGIMGNFPTIDFAAVSGNNEIVYAGLPMPVDMDPSQPSFLQATYGMGTANAGTVRMAGNYSHVAVGASLAGTGTAWAVTLTPNPAASLRKTDTLVTFPPGTFSADDAIGIKIYRDRAHADNTHTGAWRIVTLELEYITKRGA